MIKNKQQGFTLIEVLVALIILAIAFLAVMKVMHDTVRNTDHVQQKLISRWVAMNVLTEMQVGLQSMPAERQVVSGDTRMYGRQWSWDSNVVRAGSDFYQRIAINVYTNKQRITYLEGFVLKGKRHDS